MTEGFEKKNIERKEENAATQQFSFGKKNVFHPTCIMTENSSSLSLKSSANASNLDLPTILSFGRVGKLLEKKKLLVILSGRLCEIMIILSESKRGFFKLIHALRILNFH